MIDAESSNRYARLVDQEGLGDRVGEWSTLDAAGEVRSWVYPEGQALIMKIDNEDAIQGACDAVGRYLGGPMTPEYPPFRESPSNGTAREITKLSKCQLADSMREAG